MTINLKGRRRKKSDKGKGYRNARLLSGEMKKTKTTNLIYYKITQTATNVLQDVQSAFFSIYKRLNVGKKIKFPYVKAENNIRYNHKYLLLVINEFL